MDKLVIYVLPFVLLISVVVSVHELGHYGVGRLFGAAAESFSIGMGAPIAEVKDGRGTRWRLNWLPIGGFVKFVGEAQTAGDLGRVETGPVGRPYTDLGPIERMAVSFGGPIANFAYAILVYAALAMTMGVTEYRDVRVAQVVAGKAASQAGFQQGDILRKINGKDIRSTLDVTQVTELSAGDGIAFDVERAGTRKLITVVPRAVSRADEVLGLVSTVGEVGLKLESVGERTAALNPIDAVAYGVRQTGDAIASTLRVLGRMVTGREGLDKMSGPLGLANISGKLTDHQIQQQGNWSEKLIGVGLQLLLLSAAFSVGVGFFNLLPVPVLDGGAIVLCLAELITRRRIPDAVQRIGLSIGLACLLGFALVVTWNDLTRPGGPLESLTGM